MFLNEFSTVKYSFQYKYSTVQDLKQTTDNDH